MSDYQNIDNPYDTQLSRQTDQLSMQIGGIDANPVTQALINQAATNSGGTAQAGGNTAASSTSAGGPTQQVPVASGGAMADIVIQNSIQSFNWQPKAVGFYINGRTGYAEFSNVYVHGNITATTGVIGGWTITATTLTATGIILDAGNQRIVVGAGSPSIMIDGLAATIGTSTFVSGQTGWRIDADGSAEFNNIVARGEIRTSVFVKDEIHVTGGTMLVLGGSVLLNSFTSVTSPSTSTLDLQDPPSGHAQLFSVNDILRLKDGSGADNWVKVTAVSNQTTFYRYTVLKQSGSNATFYPGVAVVDYKTATDGYVLMTSDMSNAPYVDVGLSGSTPWAGTSAQARLGNLAGITDPIFGSLSGFGIWTNTGYFTGAILATSGRIGGATNYWNITSGSLSAVGSGNVEIRAGQTAYNTGTGFWIGLSSSVAMFSIGDSSANKLTWDGTTLGITGQITAGKVQTATSGQRIRLVSASDTSPTQAANSLALINANGDDILDFGSSSSVIMRIQPTHDITVGLTVANASALAVNVNLMEITMSNASSAGSALSISQSGTGAAISITAQNDSATNALLSIGDGGVLRNLVSIASTYSGASANTLLHINKSVSGVGEVLIIDNAGTGASIVINHNNTGNLFPAFSIINAGSTWAVNIDTTNSANANAPLNVITASSTAAPIRTLAAATATHYQKLIGTGGAPGPGITIWASDGNNPNGFLTGVAGDICLNGNSGHPFYCTGTTNWTQI